MGKPPMRENQPASKPFKSFDKKPICYLCGLEGQNNSAKVTQMCFVQHLHVETEPKQDQPVKMTYIEVNGTTLKALLDSGSDPTLVHRQFVPPNIIRARDTIPICCVYGDEKDYSTADMYIKVEGQTFLMNVGVADKLLYPAVLG